MKTESQIELEPLTAERLEKLVTEYGKASFQMGKLAIALPTAELCYKTSKRRGNTRDALINEVSVALGLKGVE